MATNNITSKSNPIFADEVMVSFVIKTSRDKKKKDSAVRMSFIDSMRKTVVSEIVVSPITAEALSEVLKRTLEKLDSVMKGKIEKKKDEETTYIG